jgi:chromate transporter
VSVHTGHVRTPRPTGDPTASIATIAREWTRIGSIGFGGPPSHIKLLRTLCVDDREWLTSTEFEDAVAVTTLLPGPASTQLAIYCAWRLRGTVGAIVGGLGFILPGLVLILGLSAVFLRHDLPHWLAGAAGGAGAAVPAVAVSAAAALVAASWRRAQSHDPSWRPLRRWVLYAVVSAVAASLIAAYLVIVILACGGLEYLARRPRNERAPSPLGLVLLIPARAASGGFAALSWVAIKVGMLAYGGGFVIVPLMQNDAVHRYHWMSSSQFLSAVALGQVTPGPVVHTVTAVGYAAHGVTGGLLAAAIAFTPSFIFVIVGGPRFDRLRTNIGLQSFLAGAGPAAIGGILGSAVPLALAFSHPWQYGVLALAAVWLVLFRRGVVTALIVAGALGVAAAFAGLAV